MTFVTHTAELGGAETALLRLTSSLDRDAFVPHVVVMADGPLVGRLRELAIDCVIVDVGSITEVTRKETSSLLRVPRMVGDTRRGARLVADALRAVDTDLAVAHSLKAAVMLASAARRAAVPWVWHLNDRLAADYLPRPAVTAMRALAATGPRAVIANSHATLATLGRRGRRRAFVAYPGLPDSAFVDAGRGASTGAVGLMGRIADTKGQLEFVEAARLLGGQRADLRFRIIGAALFADGDYEARVREATAELPAGLVTFTGWADDPGSELRELALLVHASPVPEPFGQVVVEAMAAGVPVIATRGGGVIEILDPHGEGTERADGVWVTPRGLLARPGDPGALARAISLALEDRVAAARRAATAQVAAREQFTIHTTAIAVAAVWNRALAGQK